MLIVLVVSAIPFVFGLFWLMAWQSGAAPLSAGLSGVGLVLLGISGPTLNIYFSMRAQKIRKERIAAREGEWGKEICDALLAKKINLDMTTDMVELALGSPTSTDNHEKTERGVKVRWIYGRKRRGATYVWFFNEKVSKISK